MIRDKKILFLGCGSMGRAIIKPLLASSNVDLKSLLIIKPSTNNLIEDLKYLTSLDQIQPSYKPDIVFFCFKPQIAKEAINQFVSQVNFDQDTIFVSILAGKKINFFKEFLGENTKLIRLMPNLPTSIGYGIAAYYSTFKISEDISLLFDIISENIIVEKEELLDAVTAVSGSGPAYLFYFAKSLIEAAEKLGLSNQQAKKLVKKTIYGSSKMMIDDPHNNLTKLISEVASKGGTTESALSILAKNNFDQIIFSALDAAFNKSKNL